MHRHWVIYSGSLVAGHFINYSATPNHRMNDNSRSRKRRGKKTYLSAVNISSNNCTVLWRNSPPGSSVQRRQSAQNIRGTLFVSVSGCASHAGGKKAGRFTRSGWRYPVWYLPLVLEFPPQSLHRENPGASWVSQKTSMVLSVLLLAEAPAVGAVPGWVVPCCCFAAWFRVFAVLNQFQLVLWRLKALALILTELY